jgi:cytochrome c
MNRLTSKHKIVRVSAISGLGIYLMVGTALADADLAKGEQVFKKCAACHSATDKTNKVGPYLLGVVGRKVASADAYKYSDGMKEYAATGAIWDEATLNSYLENPKAVVARTKMAFSGIKEEELRADLIAFLKSKM